MTSILLNLVVVFQNSCYVTYQHLLIQLNTCSLMLSSFGFWNITHLLGFPPTSLVGSSKCPFLVSLILTSKYWSAPWPFPSLPLFSIYIHSFGEFGWSLGFTCHLYTGDFPVYIFSQTSFLNLRLIHSAAH